MRVAAGFKGFSSPLDRRDRRPLSHWLTESLVTKECEDLFGREGGERGSQLVEGLVNWLTSFEETLPISADKETPINVARLVGWLCPRSPSTTCVRSVMWNRARDRLEGGSKWRRRAKYNGTLLPCCGLIYTFKRRNTGRVTVLLLSVRSSRLNLCGT